MRAPFDVLPPRAHLCPPSPGPPVPAPGRPPLPRGGEGSKSRGPTGSFLNFRPSRPGSRPPAQGPPPRLKAPHCVRSSAAGGAERQRRAPARGRGARLGVAEPPEQWCPSLCLAAAARLRPSHLHPVLKTPRLLQDTPALFPCSLRLRSPGASTTSVSADPRRSLWEPSLRCHWGPLTSLESLRSTSAPADSAREDRAGCGLELGRGDTRAGAPALRVRRLVLPLHGMPAVRGTELVARGSGLGRRAAGGVSIRTWEGRGSPWRWWVSVFLRLQLTWDPCWGSLDS